MYNRAEQVTAFLMKISIAGENECWLWKAATYNHGYGVFNWEGKKHAASRIMWQIANGREIPVGLQVCHSCDTPLCVNPRHLWLGSIQDNMRDMHLKRRTATSLTHEQVREIRAALKKPYNGIGVQLAIKYRVSRSVISSIRRGQTYSFVV
jgi:hypothetical protein